MSQPNHHFGFPLSQSAAIALQAIDPPKTGHGLQQVVRRLATLINAEHSGSGLSNLEKWADVLKQLEWDIVQFTRSHPTSPETAAMASVLADKTYSDPYRTFVYVAQLVAPADKRNKLDRLTAMVFCYYAGLGSSIPASVSHGLRLLYTQLTRPALPKDRNAWQLIANDPPLTCAQIDQALLAEPSRVVHEFLTSARLVLAGDIHPPPLEKPPTNEAAASTNPSDRTTTSPRSRANTEEPNDDASGARQPVVAPSISALMHAAQMAPLAAKAGVLHQWDALTPQALAHVTTQLIAHLNSSVPLVQARALLVLLSLLARTNPKAVLLMPTAWGDIPEESDLWFDFQRGAMRWKQQAYTQSCSTGNTDDADTSDVINDIPLPSLVAETAKRFQMRAPSARVLSDALVLNAGEDVLNMTACNAYLISLGDEAHPAAPTRFASSLGLVYLEVCGSDMAAAACGLHFELAAPSALYYFGPARNWVTQQCQRVYSFLGLGPAVQLDEGERRQGSSSVLPDLAARAGWDALQNDIVRLHHEACSANDLQTAASRASDVVTRCCLAYVLVHGGRGTTPHRMNPVSMWSCAAASGLDDKLTAGPKSMRILPRLPLADAIVRIAVGALCRLAARAGHAWSARSPLDSTFTLVQIVPSETNGLNSWIETPVSFDAIAKLSQEYFGSAPNWARHTLVTRMAEHFVDRWVIRSLTGHGSWLTTTFSYPMGVAPLDGTSAVLDALTPTLTTLFGDGSTLRQHADQLPHLPAFDWPLNLPTPRSPIQAPSEQAHYDVPDPLPLIDRQALVDWSLIELVRWRITQHDAGLSLAGHVLLAGITIDGLPVIEAERLVSRSPSLTRVGNRVGISWRRPHYVHDMWWPLQSSTTYMVRIWNGCGRIGARDVTSDVARWLRALPGFSSWPTNDHDCLDRLATAFLRWRRLTLPPSIAAMASTELETACLSPNTLHRLAGKQADQSPVLLRVPARPRSLPRIKNHQLNRITQIVHHWASDKPLGGQVARAQGALSDLNQMSPFGTPIHLMVREYVEEEMAAIIHRANHLNKVSSIATRLSTLCPTLNEFPLQADPTEFRPKEFCDLVESMHQRCLREVNKERDPTMVESQPVRSARANDALQRLFNILSYRSWEIPIEAWRSMRGEVAREARISASSSLLLKSEQSSARELIQQWLADWPLEASRTSSKFDALLAVPMRIGEASSVPLHCVTLDNHLALPKTPFAVDKSKHAPRVAPLPKDLADRLRETAHQVHRIQPHAAHLFRFDESAFESDAWGSTIIQEAARHITGDAEFRLQSLRAGAYMELLWPDWQSISRHYLLGEASPVDCRAWAGHDDVSIRWIRPIVAASSAGHGSVIPGYEHYAGAWQLVHAVSVAATLTALPPGSKWVELGSRGRAAYRQARHRQGHRFDPWGWLLPDGSLDDYPLFGDRRDGAVQAAPIPLLAEQSSMPSALSDDECKQSLLRYALYRMCEVDPTRAMHLSGIGKQIAVAIDGALPSVETCRAARARQKGTVLGRALDADVRQIDKDQGIDIIRWMSQAPYAQVVKLESVFFRNGPFSGDSLAAIRTPTFWSDLAQGLPRSLCLRPRFGLGRHLSADEHHLIRDLSPVVQIGERLRDIGARPNVMLSWRERIQTKEDARLTSLMRLACLARSVIERAAPPTQSTSDRPIRAAV